MTSKPCLAVILGLALLSWTGSHVAASVPQPTARRLVGNVVDSRTRTRLTEATVELAGLQTAVRVDSTGYFRIANVSSGLLTIRTRRLGYHPGTGTVRIDSGDSVLVEIGLDPILICLDACFPADSTPGYVRIIR